MKECSGKIGNTPLASAVTMFSIKNKIPFSITSQSVPHFDPQNNSLEEAIYNSFSSATFIL
jgi:hypothetical protein